MHRPVTGCLGSAEMRVLAGGQLSVMHPDTFEQTSLSPAVFGAQRSLLKEGATVILNMLNGEPLSGGCIKIGALCMHLQADRGCVLWPEACSPLLPGWLHMLWNPGTALCVEGFVSSLLTLLPSPAACLGRYIAVLVSGVQACFVLNFSRSEKLALQGRCVKATSGQPRHDPCGLCTILRKCLLSQDLLCIK